MTTVGGCGAGSLVPDKRIVDAGAMDMAPQQRCCYIRRSAGRRHRDNRSSHCRRHSCAAAAVVGLARPVAALGLAPSHLAAGRVFGRDLGPAVRTRPCDDLYGRVEGEIGGRGRLLFEPRGRIVV